MLDEGAPDRLDGAEEEPPADPDGGEHLRRRLRTVRVHGAVEGPGGDHDRGDAHRPRFSGRRPAATHAQRPRHGDQGDNADRPPGEVHPRRRRVEVVGGRHVGRDQRERQPLEREPRRHDAAASHTISIATLDFVSSIMRPRFAGRSSTLSLAYRDVSPGGPSLPKMRRIGTTRAQAPRWDGLCGPIAPAVERWPGRSDSGLVTAPPEESHRMHHRIVIVGAVPPGSPSRRGCAGPASGTSPLSNRPPPTLPTAVDPRRRRHRRRRQEPAQRGLGGAARRALGGRGGRRLRPRPPRGGGRDRTRLSYDVLVCCPGLELAWDLVPGLAEAMATPYASSNYTFGLAPKTARLTEGFAGGTALFRCRARPSSARGRRRRPPTSPAMPGAAGGCSTAATSPWPRGSIPCSRCRSTPPSSRGSPPTTGSAPGSRPSSSRSTPGRGFATLSGAARRAGAGRRSPTICCTPRRPARTGVRARQPARRSRPPRLGAGRPPQPASHRLPGSLLPRRHVRHADLEDRGSCPGPGGGRRRGRGRHARGTKPASATRATPPARS